MKNVAKSKKKVIFNEEIDSTINGFALVLAFLVAGTILQLKGDFFGEATIVIRFVLVVIGLIGLFTKVSNLNKRLEIYGFDNIIIGGFLMFGFYFFKNLENIVKLPDNFKFMGIIGYIILTFLFLLSFYGIFEGIMQIIYSIHLKFTSKKGKLTLISSIIAPLSQIFGLILILFQIYEIIFKK